MASPPDTSTTPFSPAPSASPPLLRLSPVTRRRIYRFVGLASWDPLRPYRFDLKQGWNSSQPPHPARFHGLLLSCRTIHAEAAALVYSANWFVLRYLPARLVSQPSLGPLHALTPVALRFLSDLKIVLNESSCHTASPYSDDRCCISSRGGSHCRPSHKHALPLSSRLPGPGEGGRVDSTLGDWHAAAARFADTEPGRLSLSLVCDINPQHPGALQIAESVVAPLLALPPSHLRECNIRLAKTADAKLQQLARDAVVHACGRSLLLASSSKAPPSNGATLATLPRELRIRILEYTDLVTPRRQVNWSREDLAYMVIARSEVLDGGQPSNDPAAQFFRCWYGTSRCGGPPPIGCFCRRRHAAFSLACNCWAPPGPALFLINRDLCEDARFVFFSRNRFIVHDYHLSVPWKVPGASEYVVTRPVPMDPYPFRRFAATRFLRDIVPRSSLQHLRFLELVFPPYLPPTWPQDGHPALRDWWETVEWLRGKINPPAFTLRLLVATVEPDRPYAHQTIITDEEADTTMRAYMNILRPLPPLAEEDGLARFHAHFALPREWTRESQLRVRRRDVVWLYQERDALKKQAERYVMGSRYETLYANGREEPEDSDWIDRFYAR